MFGGERGELVGGEQLSEDAGQVVASEVVTLASAQREPGILALQSPRSVGAHAVEEEGEELLVCTHSA